MSQRQILATSALPYVNGDVHLGHLVEYLYSDIWVQFQRLRGHKIQFFCADDTHGTATMIRAREEGIEPEALLADMSEAHQTDLAAFGVGFDYYGSTHAASNQALVNEFWAALRAAGHVAEREISQLFDPEAGVFLADRFVKGECPRCQAPDQYGDNCDACGATYSPDELTNPRSTLSGAVPETRTAKHFFIVLSNFQDFLNEWTQNGKHVQPDIAKWLKGSFLAEPLRDWDVSRPGPYFGFEIPDAPGHYFYVWVDAPIGYISATKDWCDANGHDLDDWWKNENCEIHHFIGKDIAYFHTLFWPAMLKTAGYCLPEKIHVHGFLTVNGEKMSKSKGTYILARTYLEHLSPDYLRYYFASKLSRTVQDIDLNFDEFCAKVNSDLVGKVVNLASRTARFVEGQALCPYPDDGGLFGDGASAGNEIAQYYEACDYGKALRSIMALADRANEYVEAKAPWVLRKDPEKAGELLEVCTVALNLFRQITIYLCPVLPNLAERASGLLGVEPARWQDAATPVAGSVVAKFEHLMQRVDPKHIEAMIEASRESVS